MATSIVACGGDPGVVVPGTGGPPPTSLAALPECRAPVAPSPAVDLDVPLPEGAYLTITETEGPLVQANGWAPLTPVDVRGYYERSSVPWSIVAVEDEVYESETLVDVTGRRVFVQAIATCPEGSDLYVRVIEQPDSQP